MVESVLIRRLDNGYVTESVTKQRTANMYHSNLKGVIAEVNRALGRLSKDQVDFFSTKILKKDAKN